MFHNFFFIFSAVSYNKKLKALKHEVSKHEVPNCLSIKTVIQEISIVRLTTVI